MLPPTRPTLSIPETTRTMGVSRRTIYNWIAAGKIEYVRTAGGNIRIFADTLFQDAQPTTSDAVKPLRSRNFIQ